MRNGIKMKITRVAIVLFIPLLFEVVLSCRECPEAYEQRYGLESLFIQNLDNSGELPVESATGIIPKAAYAVGINFRLLRLANLNKVKLAILPQAHAMRCASCFDTIWYARDTIRTIKLTTVNYFDKNHPAGSDVTGLFKGLSYKTYIPVDKAIINTETSRVYKFEDSRTRLDLYLMSPPENVGLYRFKIDVILSNNGIISVMSPDVELK